MQSLRTEARECVKTLGCDTLVSFCYGKIFGPKFLSLFENKFNIHPSLLPKYRGCSPLYESIVNLDREGGISIQEIALEVDSGDILSSTSFPLNGTETLTSLEDRVAVMAAQLASEVFSDVSSYQMRKQEGDVTYSRMLKKEDGEMVPAFTVYLNGCSLQGQETISQSSGMMLKRNIPKFLTELGKTVENSGKTYEEWVKEHSEDVKAIAEKYL